MRIFLTDYQKLLVRSLLFQPFLLCILYLVFNTLFMQSFDFTGLLFWFVAWVVFDIVVVWREHKQVLKSSINKDALLHGCVKKEYSSSFTLHELVEKVTKDSSWKFKIVTSNIDENQARFSLHHYKLEKSKTIELQLTSFNEGTHVEIQISTIKRPFVGFFLINVSMTIKIVDELQQKLEQ
jgi:hypothetical protein